MKQTKTELALRALSLAAAVTWVAGAANAQDSHYTVTSGGLEAFNLQIDTSTYDGALAGGLDFTKTSGPGASSFESVCTDLGGTLWLGGNYSYAPPTVFQGQTGIAPIWGVGNATSDANPANAAAAIQAAADIFYKYGSVLTTGTSDQRAGLQLAVWAALYNTVGGSTPSTGLDGPRFSILGTSSDTWSGSWGSTSVGTSAAITDAQTYLGAVNFSDQYTGSLLVPDPEIQNGGYGTTYNEIAQEVMMGVTPVPEPTTMVAGALLLLPFAASTVRLRKKRSA